MATGLLFAVAAAQGQVYERMFSFTEARLDEIRNSPNRGARPSAELVKGSDGNFYGTAPYGGANGCRSIFRVTPSGVVTTLVEFTGNGVSNRVGPTRKIH